MARSGAIKVMIASVALASAAATRAEQMYGQAAPGRLILAANDFAQGGPGAAIAPRRSLEWDARKGRWGLKLGVEQRVDRGVELKDLQPGVYYRLTPRLHIGGAVSLAPDGLANQRLTDPQLPAPRVRLETTFKF